jgi:hypothetical protein
MSKSVCFIYNRITKSQEKEPGQWCVSFPGIVAVTGNFGRIIRHRDPKTNCPKPGGFTSKRGLHIQYSKSLYCVAHPATCQAYIRCNNILCSPLSPSQTWDINNDDISVAPVANLSVPTSNNRVVEDTDVDKIEYAQKTSQFDIKYTTEQFTKTKLLKILSDVATPHFLYQDILSWASEAKDNKYSFCPQRLELSSQVKYLEKWLHLKPCYPEMVRLYLVL